MFRESWLSDSRFAGLTTSSFATLRFGNPAYYLTWLFARRKERKIQE